MRRESKVTIAVCIEDGKTYRFNSVNALCREIGISITYALRRLNTGTPSKGYLFFTSDFINSPEAQEHLDSKVNGWRTKKEAAQAKKKGLVSVYIDRRTTLLVPSDKWTPDYAERYKERIEASRPQSHTQGFRERNNTIKTQLPKRGPGRPRKEKR